MKISDDVRNLYESSFPVEERQPTEAVQALIDKGRIRLDTTRDADGRLKVYSFISIHDENPGFKFAHLDFVATDPALRSKGIGTLHLDRMNATLKRESPDYVAMTFEMEDPKAPGLSAEQVAHREFRSKFYERQGARNTLPGRVDAKGNYEPGYKILDFDQIADAKTWKAAEDNQPAEWRAYIYKPQKYDPLKAALTFYRDEGGYGLESSHPAVAELLRLHSKNMSWLKKLDKQ
jgi:GNAT superfamily N-acetyltransferase